MDRDTKEKAIDTGYYNGIDLDAENYVPVGFEKAEDGYILKFKDKEEIFEVPVSSVLLSRLLRSLRAHRLNEIEKNENLHESVQPASFRRSA